MRTQSRVNVTVVLEYKSTSVFLLIINDLREQISAVLSHNCLLMTARCTWKSTQQMIRLYSSVT